jgi:hypothetical protein
VNVGSRAHYIGAEGGAHYPLIEGIAPDQGGELDLVPCGSSLLEINSNILSHHTSNGVDPSTLLIGVLFSTYTAVRIASPHN